MIISRKRFEAAIREAEARGAASEIARRCTVEYLMQLSNVIHVLKSCADKPESNQQPVSFFMGK